MTEVTPVRIGYVYVAAAYDDGLVKIGYTYQKPSCACSSYQPVSPAGFSFFTSLKPRNRNGLS
jgi:hypothetical protein